MSRFADMSLGSYLDVVDNGQDLQLGGWSSPNEDTRPGYSQRSELHLPTRDDDGKSGLSKRSANVCRTDRRRTLFHRMPMPIFKVRMYNANDSVCGGGGPVYFPSYKDVIGWDVLFDFLDFW